MKNKPNYNPPPGRKLDWAPYTVTEDGRVFSHITWKFLKQNRNSAKYLQVWLIPNESGKKGKWWRVHRLVAALFVPNPYNLPEVGHKDNIKDHNHYTNLCWTTHQDNMKNGRRADAKPMPKGEAHWAYGTRAKTLTKKKMSLAKQGEGHPKFKGHYIYQGEKYNSFQHLANSINSYPMAVRRMFLKGEVTFEPVVPEGVK